MPKRIERQVRNELRQAGNNEQAEKLAKDAVANLAQRPPELGPKLEQPSVPVGLVALCVALGKREWLPGRL